MATPAHLALTPEIDAFRREFERLSSEADALVAPLSDAQFNWQPAPAAWSVAQCIDHLNITARQYLPSLDEGIADAIRRGQYAEGPFAYNWIGRLFVRTMEPPVRLKVKTPASFQPPPSRSRHEIMAAHERRHLWQAGRVIAAPGLPR